MYIHVVICMYACMSPYVCVYIHIYIYICMHICMCTERERERDDLGIHIMLYYGFKGTLTSQGAYREAQALNKSRGEGAPMKPNRMFLESTPVLKEYDTGLGSEPA